MADSRVRRQNPSVSLSMYEVYNELVKDLLQVPSSRSTYLELGVTAEKGTYVKVGILAFSLQQIFPPKFQLLL